MSSRVGVGGTGVFEGRLVTLAWTAGKLAAGFSSTGEVAVTDAQPTAASNTRKAIKIVAFLSINHLTYWEIKLI